MPAKKPAKTTKKVTKKLVKKTKTATIPKPRKATKQVASRTLPTLQTLLEAGAHFGHRKERSVPTARQYTFVIRDGVSVINLEQTLAKLQAVIAFLKTFDLTNQTILFVGTKRQARDTVKEVAVALAQPYVSERWMGGTLTNFDIIRENIKRLTALDQILSDPAKQSRHTKKELLKMNEEAAKLHKNFDGIVGLERLPNVLMIVDPHEEAIALSEARSLDIPVIAICDTDTDPDSITFPIPANDDAPKTIRLILEQIRWALERPQVGKE